MTTKDYYPANTEWEVVAAHSVLADCNFKIKVALRNKGGTVDLNVIREVRTPYRPRIGQLIKLSRQDA